jgi:hypothetical protein
MKDLGLIPFVRLFPQQAANETRVLTTRRYPGLPDDEYGLLESYCPDLRCNRRRVMLNVVGRWRRAILATVSYGFDRDAAMAGPFLDPLNPQSTYADTLLGLVEEVLEDPAYVARLQAHYHRVKGAMADRSHPARQLLAQSVQDDRIRPSRPRGTRCKRRDR